MYLNFTHSADMFCVTPILYNPANPDPVEQLMEKFSLACEPHRHEGTWLMEAVQRYIYTCPTFIYSWLIRADQATIAEIVRRGIPVAGCDMKVWRLIARIYKRKTHNPVDPCYL